MGRRPLRLGFKQLTVIKSRQSKRELCQPLPEPSPRRPGRGDGGRQVGKGTRGNLLCSGFGSAALIFPEL